VHNALGLALVQLKRWDEAIASFERALETGAAPGPGQYNLACALARAGRKPQALERLARAADAGYGRRADWQADEDLASLRGDPRFDALLARLPQ
jgi:tetratricopeptide (TPR) repeat protein